MGEDESVSVNEKAIMVDACMPPGILQIENKDRCGREAQGVINRESCKVPFQNCP
jgi:hypothetical protein